MNGILALLLGCALSTGAPASDAAPANGLMPPPDTGAVAVQMDPGNPTVGLSVLVPVGSSHDPEGREGAARLLADALTLAGEDRGAPLGARVVSDVHGDFTVFTATAPAHAWEEAQRTLDDLLFRDTLPPEAVESVRARTLSRLTFEDGSPVRSFRQRSRELLLGGEGLWARPTRGTVETVRGLDPGVLETFREERYRRDEAVWAFTGPVDQGALEALLPGRPVLTAAERAPEDREADGLAAEPRPADTVEDARTLRAEEEPGHAPAPARPGAEDGAAWSEGERVEVEREVTSTWIVVAYPLPPSTSPRELEFLAKVAEDRLTPSPPDRDLFELRTEARQLPDGPALLVHATVFPAAVYRWEERIRDGVEVLATNPPEGEFFHLARRSFRTERLLEDADPGPRSRRLARELFEHGTVETVTAGLGVQDSDRLSELVRALGPPRVLLYGPLEMARPVGDEDTEGG